MKSMLKTSTSLYCVAHILAAVENVLYRHSHPRELVIGAGDFVTVAERDVRRRAQCLFVRERPDKLLSRFRAWLRLCLVSGYFLSASRFARTVASLTATARQRALPDFQPAQFLRPASRQGAFSRPFPALRLRRVVAGSPFGI
jgi:hypothetical protein